MTTINDVLRSLPPLGADKIAQGVRAGDLVSLKDAVAACGYKTPASVRSRLINKTIEAHCKFGRVIYFSRNQIEMMKETRGMWMKAVNP